MRRLRLPFRLSEIVAVVVALTLGYLVTDHFSLEHDNSAPFLETAAPDQTAHLTYADVKVTDVRAAQYLRPDTSETLVSPSGVFLLITTELTATREPTIFGTTVLVDDRGRKYLPSQKSSCPIGPQSQTGVTTYVLLCFEVTPDRLTQLHLRVARGGNFLKSTRYDDMADIDLHITAREAADMAKTKAAYQVVGESDRPFTLEPVTVTGPTT